jgi:hypothetical protein
VSADLSCVSRAATRSVLQFSGPTTARCFALAPFLIGAVRVGRLGTHLENRPGAYTVEARYGTEQNSKLP